ncbi:MAG: metallophosphoesterase family protein, partial [Gemmataceae bacterium]
MIRFAHLSDIHVTAPKCRWQLRDFASRRVGGWLNHRVLGRKYRFRHAEQVLRTLKAEIVGRSIEHVIFSGDATALGFEEEFQNAVTLLGADGSTKGIAVPGNHDYPTGPAARSGAFEEHFAPWQQGIRVDDATYPFAQEVGG